MKDFLVLAKIIEKSKSLIIEIALLHFDYERKGAYKLHQLILVMTTNFEDRMLRNYLRNKLTRKHVIEELAKYHSNEVMDRKLICQNCCNEGKLTRNLKDKRSKKNLKFLKRCSGCKAVNYCSEECQLIDWNDYHHKCYILRFFMR